MGPQPQTNHTPETQPQPALHEMLSLLESTQMPKQHFPPTKSQDRSMAYWTPTFRSGKGPVGTNGLHLYPKSSSTSTSCLSNSCTMALDLAGYTFRCSSSNMLYNVSPTSFAFMTTNFEPLTPLRIRPTPQTRLQELSLWLSPLHSTKEITLCLELFFYHITAMVWIQLKSF